MAKKIHEVLIDFYVKKIPDFKKETFDRQKQTDNVVVWIAGLSTGAIALIMSKTIGNTSIDVISLKVSVGFFLLTIISAVVFRSFVYNLQQKESNVIFNFEGYCWGATSETYGPIQITEETTIAEIAESLKNDMDLDYDSWLEKEYLDREFWVEHYQYWALFWEQQEKIGLKNLAMAIAPLLGKEPSDVNETIITEHNNTLQIANLVKLRKVCERAYNGVMLFFIFAISTIALGFFVS